MKTVMFYVVSLVLVIAMAIIIYYDKPMISPQMIAVDREYVLIAGRDTTIDIPLYINISNHDFLNTEHHISAYLTSASGSKKMDIQLLDIIKGQQEFYLDMLWTERIFIYDFSLTGFDFKIDDCYLDVTLESGHNYLIRLGRLAIVDVDEGSEHLDWNALSATKKEHSLFSRIDTIRIEYIKLNTEIDAISIGIDEDCVFTRHDDYIVIDVPRRPYLLNRVPVIIDFTDGTVQVIDSFTYIIDHHILKESGFLVTTYALH